MLIASIIKIAWRNLGRNRKRTLLAMSAIAVGQLAFMMTAALMNGYSRDYLDSVTGPLLGHAQVHAPKWRDDHSIDLTINNLDGTLAQVRQDPQVENAAPRVFAPVLAAVGEDGYTAMVVGIDPEAEIHRDGLLGEAGLVSEKANREEWTGRRRAAQEETQIPGGTEQAGVPAGKTPAGLGAASLGNRRVLIGHSLARKHDIEAGVEIALMGQDVDGSIANNLFFVEGVIETPADLVNSMGVVMSLEDAQEFLLLPDQAHEIVIHVKNQALLDSTVARLSSLPLLRETEVLSWREIMPQAAAMMRIFDVFSLFVLFIVFIAALAGVANTMLMSTFERKHEFGMLLSLGCGPGQLSRIVAVEAVLLGILGVAMGTALGLAFVLITSGSGIDYAALGGQESSYEWEFQGVHASSRVIPEVRAGNIISGVVAVLLTSFLSVMWPMFHVSRMEPREAMRP